jgi:hypothetical protein
MFQAESFRNFDLKHVLSGFNFVNTNYNFPLGRIFLKASPTLDRGFFALGLIIFIVSLAVVFWIERHASLIFGIKV